MINRKYKDRVFRMIFGYDKYKVNLLELYNALNGTHHTNIDDLEITTIEDFIYMGMKNDVSCILAPDSMMSLFEHTSTYCANMPIRGLMYFARLYEKYIVKNKMNVYGSKMLKLPAPQYYVFFNVEANQPDRKELRLSDAFEKKVEGFEWKAVMLNINLNKNKELMERCKILQEYAIFVNKMQTNTRKYDSIEVAADVTVQECIEEGIFKDMLMEHKAEVVSMLFTEYDEERAMRIFADDARAEGLAEGRAEGLAEGRAEGRAEGLAEGRAEGLAEGRAEGLAEGLTVGKKEMTIKLFIENYLPLEKALEETGLTESDFQKAVDEYKQQTKS